VLRNASQTACPRWLPLALFAALALASPAGVDPVEQSVATAGSIGIWASRDELAELPASGPAWDRLVEWAARPADRPNIADQTDLTDVVVLAKALVWARTGEDSYRQEVIQACGAAIGTETGGTTLALGRNLAGYVIAADLIELPPADAYAFRGWLRAVLWENLAGRTLRSTQEDRPNNWGTHAAASRIAVALYLRDTEELEDAARVFRGYLGDREAYARFRFGALDWQADPMRPVGVNPRGAVKYGHNVDGVLPDDQRRCCDHFVWPPPAENYAYEALQGALASAVMLNRAGYDVWEWEDRALLRAFRWLHDEAHFPAQGDDTWEPHIVNRYYRTAFPAPVPSRPGKNVGFTDWTHGPRLAD